MVLNGDIDICCYWVTTVSEVAEVGLSTLHQIQIVNFFKILLIVHFLQLLPSPLPPITNVHSLWRPVESASPDYGNIFIRIIHIYRKENSVSHQDYNEPVTAGCQGTNVHFLFRIFFFSGCFVQFMVQKIFCQVLYILWVMWCTIQCANAASSPSPSSASSSFTLEELMT